MPGSDKVNHCCMKWMRSMISREKRWSAVDALRVVWGNQFDQCSPRHDLFHLLQKLTLARLSETEVDIKSGLFHRLNIAILGLKNVLMAGEFCRVSLTSTLSSL